MFRKLAFWVSLSASFMVHTAVRAQTQTADACAAAVLATNGAQTQWGWLQWLLMALCLVLFVVAYGLIFWATARHRRRSEQAKWWRDSRLADLLWTLLPLLFVVAMLWPMFKPMLLAEPSAQSSSQALIVHIDDGLPTTAADCAPNSR